MNVALVRVSVDDTEKIWAMQIKAFQNLLEKYQDFETSPANETKEKIKTKLLQEYTFFYYGFLTSIGIKKMYLQPFNFNIKFIDTFL